MTQGGGLAVALAAAAGVAPMVAACNGDAGMTECDCPDPTVRIEVPGDRAPAALGVTLSGRACEGATAQCTQPDGSGCAEYTFLATAVGVCDIDVQFAASPADYQEQVTFNSTTCCPGSYIDPPTASPIELPSASGDAGAGE